MSACSRAGRNTLILAGFMTHMCISASARAALDLGYQTTVIARCDRDPRAARP